MCNKHGDTSGAKGYVPVKYIEELSAMESAKYVDKSNTRARGRNVYSRETTPQPQPTTNPRQSISLQQPKSTAPFLSSSVASFNPNPTPVNKTLTDPALAFVDNYERQEKMFRQILKQREETFKRLEHRLSEASKEIDHFVKKNDDLIERIKMLDTEIESERSALIEPLTSGNRTSQPKMRTTKIN
jgi:hypothetical protein